MVSMTDESVPPMPTCLPRCDSNYSASRHRCRDCRRQELTVKWEERSDMTQVRKSSKYCELKDACQVHGLKPWLVPMKVGCPGFLDSCLGDAQAIWILGTIRKRAEKGSNCIWHLRDVRERKIDNTLKNSQIHRGSDNSRASWFWRVKA